MVMLDVNAAWPSILWRLAPIFLVRILPAYSPQGAGLMSRLPVTTNSWIGLPAFHGWEATRLAVTVEQKPLTIVSSSPWISRRTLGPTLNVPPTVIGSCSSGSKTDFGGFWFEPPPEAAIITAIAAKPTGTATTVLATAQPDRSAITGMSAIRRIISLPRRRRAGPSGRGDCRTGC